MATRTFILGVLLLALATPACPLGDRYMLPRTLDITLLMDADPKAPGTFTLTGKAKALALDLPQVTLKFNLPADVEAVGAVAEKKEALARDREVTVSVTVKLKDPAKKALVGFSVTYDHPTDFWLKYIEDHQKGYPSMVLRDRLVRELLEQKGKPVSESRVTVLEKGAK